MDRVKAGGVAEEELCHILDVGLGPGPRKWAKTARTTPWAAVLAQLFERSTARATPVPPNIYCVSADIAEAYAGRAEAARRLTDPTFADLHPQLRLVMQTLDERFGGCLIEASERL